MKNPKSPAPAEKPKSMPGSSPGSAAALGVTVKTTVERGHAYMVPRLYNVEISVLEVVRGHEALERFKAQQIPTGALRRGFEYVLARIRFGYFERGRVTAGSPAGSEEDVQFVSFGGGSVDVTYTLTEGQLSAFSASGETEYEVPHMAQQPEPGLTGREFHPGETHEGWLVLQALEDEKKPLLVFKREHVEGVYGIWGYVWFQL